MDNPGKQNRYTMTGAELFVGRIPFLEPMAARMYQRRLAFAELVATSSRAARAYFEGASNGDHTGTWKRLPDGVTGPGEWTRSDGQTLRERARWLGSNSTYGAAIVNLINDGAVGTGIMTQCQIEWLPERTGDADTDLQNKKANSRLNYEIEMLKEEWAMADADFAGEDSLYDMQRTALATVCKEGNILLHRIIRNASETRSGIPISYALYGHDRIATEQGTPKVAANKVINGFEYDPSGRKAYVWIRSDGYASTPIPIPMSECRHIYRRDFPGQAEGISWMSPVIAALYGVHDIEKNTRITRALQTAIAALVSHDPSKSTAAMPGKTEKSTDAAGKTKILGTIESGSIIDVGNGNIHSFNPSKQDDFDAIIGVICRGMGAGMGLSAELVSGDLRGLSFAGGRIGLGRHYRTTNVIHAFFTRKFDARVHMDFIDFGASAGKIAVPRGRTRYQAAFTAPKQDMSVNPYQDIAAAALAIENKMLSHKEWYAASNRDVMDEFSQIRAEAIDVSEIDAIEAKKKLADLLSGATLNQFKAELAAMLKDEGETA
jgi:lambda family phage portal protein